MAASFVFPTSGPSIPSLSFASPRGKLYRSQTQRLPHGGLCSTQQPCDRLESKPENVSDAPALRSSQSLAVEVLRQNHVVVITQAGTGLPRNFRAIRALFSVSVYLTLSWIPRMLVLLFFPQWVDPAYSPVYFYRKLLVSRPVGA